MKNKVPIFVTGRLMVNDWIQFIQSQCKSVAGVPVLNQPALKLIVISITDPESNDAPLNIAENDILRLKFHDLEETYPFDPKYAAIILFDKNFADLILKFINTHFCDNLAILVHCEAGISRSAAVAAALAQHFNGNNERFFRDPLMPNKLVYSTLSAVIQEANTEKSP